MKDKPIPEPVQFASSTHGEPYACSLVGYPNSPSMPHDIDTEMVNGCAICKAEATAYMATSQKNLVTIFMECGRELASYAPKDSERVVIAPRNCIQHGDYIIGQDPDLPQYDVIFAPDDAVSNIYREPINELFISE